MVSTKEIVAFAESLRPGLEENCGMRNSSCYDRADAKRVYMSSTVEGDKCNDDS